MDTDSERAGLSFDHDVKPLFRERDRGSMLATFDLWQRDDVAENADPILKALEDGSMPCDGAWPAERVDVLRRWVNAGMPA
jgi:hypothetical protein